MSVGSMLYPGLLHSVIISSSPFLNKEYKNYNGVNIDENLNNVGDALVQLGRALNIRYITIKRDLQIEGRSWEMAASKAMQGKVGTYSGTVESFDGSIILYGHVPGIELKRKLSNTLNTYKNDPHDLLSR
jgi:hypothetical protein